MTISRTTQLLAIAFASIIINVPAQAQKRGINYEECLLLKIENDGSGNKIENDGSGNKVENDGSGNKVENDGSGNKTKCQLSLLERLFTSL